VSRGMNRRKPCNPVQWSQRRSFLAITTFARVLRFHMWILVLYPAVDTSANTEHNHEECRNQAYDQGNKPKHDHCPQDTDDQIHRSCLPKQSRAWSSRAMESIDRNMCQTCGENDTGTASTSEVVPGRVHQVQATTGASVITPLNVRWPSSTSTTTSSPSRISPLSNFIASGSRIRFWITRLRGRPPN
jgi:hypothetical protein